MPSKRGKKSPVRAFAAVFIAAAVSNLPVAVHAYPSKALELPNGERVPCPSDAEDGAGAGCLDGYCRGLGHESCAGGHVTPALNPFGLSVRSAGFEWTAELCEADSDGDGYTNGEELGDPCCVWTRAHASAFGEAVYTKAFSPTHPGDADHFPPSDYVRPECGTDLTTPPAPDDDAEIEPIETAAFNPGEAQGSFEFRIKPYPIPKQRTTYVDFVFNLPTLLDANGQPADVVHVVYGEALVSQPGHLHHFVVTGCRAPIDDDLEGMPLETVPEECSVPIGGFSGWAPGATMWDLPTNAGVSIGPGFGIRAVQLNVHYTDGDAPYLNGEHAIATDGMRIYYTPDLRPKTMIAVPVIQVGFGPETMLIAPNKKRHFMTRTCTVKSRCADHDDRTMNFIGSRALGDPELTCASGAAKFFCISDLFQVACPASCGLCEEGGSSRLVDEWDATGVYYHGHLLGKEMYMTLIPGEDGTDNDRQQSKIDLSSRDIWTYDDQPIFPLGTHTKIRTGDKIQTTCVFDSTERTEPTKFDLETVDEMCINTIMVIFDTPNLHKEDEEETKGVTTAANEVYLRAFRCETSPESDIWMGDLEINESAQDIVDAHPLEEEECSWPTGLWIFDAVPSFEMRCNGEIVDKGMFVGDDEEQEEGGEGGQRICSGMPGALFRPQANAGSACTGGKYNERDANDGTTEEQCLEGGGTWSPYTCMEAEKFLRDSVDVTSDVKQYIREFWWRPRCCDGAAESDGGSEGGDGAQEEGMGDVSDGEGDEAKEEIASVSSAATSVARRGVSALVVMSLLGVCF